MLGIGNGLSAGLNPFLQQQQQAPERQASQWKVAEFTNYLKQNGLQQLANQGDSVSFGKSNQAQSNLNGGQQTPKINLNFAGTQGNRVAADDLNNAKQAFQALTGRALPDKPPSANEAQQQRNQSATLGLV